ncbi:MAG: GGDEF domain-containing protein [Aliidiomarina sp.]|uniref:GGDEF domain-containing protein n=1 Tax=Aliidiomarina sp. TaxID=1872439 RepID=UPI0025BEF66C|nr:GGDEF domain-containing protein [Aliidiomarina sp.]MCH8501157.1 GGDEF domain-containing protein [Aliidiomarina sp.]
MSQGIYLSLLSVLISLTCAIYLSYLPKPEKLAQRVALKNFVWFYLLSSLATAVFFYTLTMTTVIGAFMGGAANVALVTLSCHALLAAVLCFRGNPRFVLQLKFAWLHSLGIAVVLSSELNFQQVINLYWARGLLYSNMIAVLLIALVLFLRASRLTNLRQRIFAISLGIMGGSYSLVLLTDLYFRNSELYHLVFVIGQNVGFVAMLAGIYSYYILAIAEAREFDAITDPLTGLYNRRVLAEQQQKMLNIDLLNAKQLSVIAIDIDRFKSINDTYGHAVGDQAIQAIANAIRDTIRSHDIAVRSGGDEFLVMLPDSSVRDTQSCAQRIRQAVAAAKLKVADTNLTIEISTGTAGPSHHLESLIRQADQGLYVDKGR